MQKQSGNLHGSRTLSRRDALKQLGTAGAGVVLGAPAILSGQRTDIRVAGRAVEIAVASLSPSTVRITVLPLEGGRAAAVPVDGALVREDLGRQLARGRSAGAVSTVKAGDLIVRVTADPPTLHVETAKGEPVQRLTLDAEAPGLSFLLGKGPLLGLGQGGPQFDRKGSTDDMRSGQAGYRLATHGGRVPIQWLLGTDGWGLFIHHPLGTFDFTGTQGKFAPAADPLPLDLFVVGSSDPLKIMGEYAAITGRPELPALWTFGYMQSHRTLNGPEEILQVAQTFREKKLPCDTLIYLGTEFAPSGWNTRNGEFSWHPQNFPDPKALIDKLHALNYRVVLHVVVEGQRLSGTVADRCDRQPLPSGRTAQGDWPPDRSVACYWPHHKFVFDVGIDGWWPDQGDGLDAPSRLARIRMYWEGSQLWRLKERPFALHRNGYAGMARYAAFLWSGDVFTTWETLATHIPVAINAGLSGIPYWGTDIGGFVPTKEYTGELHLRWFQFGAFCPLFRAHGRTWHLRLPWGWNTGQLGPNEIRASTPGAANPDPSELHHAQVEPICRKYLELRYRLLPYTYTAAQETCESGLPLMRALWLHYPNDPPAVARGDEFLWGRDILVAPVVEPGAKTRRLYLPRGSWFDFWTEEKVEGGREIDRPVDLETMPLYVRAGAILPLGPVKEYTDQEVDGPLTVVIYPGAEGAFTLYEDDGKTFEYRKGELMRVEMAWRNADRRLTLRLASGSRMRAPTPRHIEIRVAGETTARSIVFDGKPMDLSL